MVKKVQHAPPPVLEKRDRGSETRTIAALMKPIQKTALILGSAAALFGATLPPRALAAPRPGPRPTPVQLATTQSFTGLETAEALLEDLNFRNLELHDREMLNKAVAARPAKGGKVTFSIDNGWPSSALTPTFSIPSSSAPAAASKGGGAPGCADLNAYVRLLARLRPGGVVSGRFADWRATSVYRAVAGYHNGYDIAYPPGTPIAAGWPGQVVSIANWYGAEHGITVQSPEGFRTTYGHLSPATRVGAFVNPGDIVGRVVNDHVDVKMRAFGGGFVDFAHGVPGISGGKASAYAGPAVATGASGGRVVVTMHIPAATAAAPRILPPLAGPAWSRRPEAVRAAIAYLRARHQEANLLMQGATAPGGTLASVRHQIEESRGRLLVNGIPEDLLLAAFVRAEPLRQGAFWFGGGLSSDAQVDVLDEESARRGEMVRNAEEALPKLQALLRDLNAQAPPPRRS